LVVAEVVEVAVGAAGFVAVRIRNADKQSRGAESAGVGVGVANGGIGVCSSATYRAMWHSAAALTGGYHRAFASAVVSAVVSVILAYIILRPDEDVAEPADVLAAESEGPPSPQESHSLSSPRNAAANAAGSLSGDHSFAAKPP